jgi:hypothetical protein
VAEPAVNVLERASSSHLRAQSFVDSVLGIANGIDSPADRQMRITIADRSLNLHFASPALQARFAPAFAHLQERGRTAEIAVTLWDPAAPAPPLPPLPWPPEAYRSCGEIPGYSDGSSYVHFDVPMSALTVFDPQRGRAAYFNRRPQSLPAYEFAGPLRYLIHRIAIDRGMSLVHAAAVAKDGRGALIAGPKGAGKSTTALACLAAGLDYLGDDRCMVAPRGDGHRIYSVFSSAKIFLDDVHRHRIARLADAILQPTTEDDRKGLLYVDQVAPAQMARSAVLRCILIPVQTGAERSTIVQAPPSEALRLLIAELVGRSPVTAPRSLAILRQVCATVPVFRLQAGRHLQEVAETVAWALERY